MCIRDRPSTTDLTVAMTDPAELVDLLVDLAEATGAFYGHVASQSHLAQLRGPFAHARRARHGPSPSGGQPPSWTPPPFQILEAQLPDVFWVQVFGPAFVAKWGEDTLERAGVRRRRLGHGGFVVWASDEPPAYDEHAATPEAYAWKRAMYDAIGPEPFTRSDRGWNEFGVHVPFMTEHASAIQAW